jgi:hypothetical protein
VASLTSTEKVAALSQELGQSEPETTEDAQMLALMQTIGPIVGQFLPSDPDALDELLLRGARWALSLRSDDAEEVTIEDLCSE